MNGPAIPIVETEGDFPGDSLLGDRGGNGSIPPTPTAPTPTLLPLNDEVGVKNTKDEEVDGVTSKGSNSNPSITSLVVYALFGRRMLNRKKRIKKHTYSRRVCVSTVSSSSLVLVLVAY